MRIAFVVAAARNGVIGRAGGLPWRLPSELKRFRAITMGKPMVMGRKTWESLPRRPLPGRAHIVVTRDPNYRAPGGHVAHSPEAALALARDLAHESGAAEIAVIGGGDIFRQLLPAADRIYLTWVEAEPEGDTWLPPLDPGDWVEVERHQRLRTERDSHDFTLVVLDRKR